MSSQMLGVTLAKTRSSAGAQLLVRAVPPEPATTPASSCSAPVEAVLGHGDPGRLRTRLSSPARPRPATWAVPDLRQRACQACQDGRQPSAPPPPRWRRRWPVRRRCRRPGRTLGDHQQDRSEIADLVLSSTEKGRGACFKAAHPIRKGTGRRTRRRSARGRPPLGYAVLGKRGPGCQPSSRICRRSAWLPGSSSRGPVSAALALSSIPASRQWEKTQPASAPRRR